MDGMYKIESIQALRFFAALLVVIDHTLLALTSAGSLPSSTNEVAWLLGEMGVYVFFSISGFIMLITNKERFGRDRAIGDFLVRRIVRVAPIYWLFTTWVVLSSIINADPITLEQTWKSYLFIPVANTLGQMRPLHGVGWTLNYEMLFYGVFAATMALRFRTGVIAVLAALAGFVFAGCVLRTPFDLGEPQGLLEVWTSPILLLFGLGVLIGLARFRFGVVAWPISPWILGAAMVLPLIAFYLKGDPLSVWWRVFAAVTAAGVVTLAAFTRLPLGAVRLLVRGGDASYSLYLVHTFVIGTLSRRLPDLAGHQPVLFFLTAVSASIAAGFLTRAIIEKPLTRLFWAGATHLHSALGLNRAPKRPPPPPSIHPDGA